MKFFAVVFLAMVASSAANWDAAYFRSKDDGFKVYSNWMKEVPGHVRLSQMAIPGTHDSGAHGGLDNDMLYTQVLTFDEQLLYGIRFFEINVQHKNNLFGIYRNAHLFYGFDEFLGSVQKFLVKNPSETVIFKLRNIGDLGGNTRTLVETLKHYLTDPAYDRFLQTTNVDVTLDAVRGRFIMFSDTEDFNNYGIRFVYDFVQGDYRMGTNWDLYDRWMLIKNHLNKTVVGDSNTFYFNFLSGYGGSFPYFVASGHSSPGTSAPRLATGKTSPGWTDWPDFPRVNCLGAICTIAFEGTNMLTRDQVQKINERSDMTRTVGVILVDFPGSGLIEVIIRNNKILT